jgi:hypothetical protein
VDGGGAITPFGPVAPSGGFWACPVTLPSTDPKLSFELRAYFRGGDGSSCVSLHYDEKLADETCSALTGGKDDSGKDDLTAAERLAGYVGPFTITYPEPKVVRDVAYEAIVSERVTPPHNRFHYEPVFNVNPPKVRSAYLPNVGPGLYVVRFLIFTERGQARTYTKVIRVRP